MARVSVDETALSDPRFQNLADLMGSGDPDLALGRMVRVWNQCVQRCSYKLPAAVIAGIFRNAASVTWIVTAELAVDLGDGMFRIKGTKGRTDYLKKLSESNRNRQRRYRERNALLTRESRVTNATVTGVPTPTPTPALLQLQEQHTSLEPPAAVTRTVRVPRVPRNGKVKPSALVSTERIEELQEWFDKLYGFYPRHVGKTAAWRAFVALEPTLDDCKTIAGDIRRRVEAQEWQPTEPERARFIPHLATYLNQRRWMDS